MHCIHFHFNKETLENPDESNWYSIIAVRCVEILKIYLGKMQHF